MRLLVVRHAIAVPAGTPDIPDDERPLTRRGRKRFKKAARGLARIVRTPDVVLASPLPRARETADIAARAWGDVEVTEDPRLARGRSDEVLASIPEWGKDDLVALFGHEPRVSALLAHVIGGEGERLPFKKGGAALVELDGDTGAVRGRLIWFLPPRLLRRLGGA